MNRLAITTAAVAALAVLAVSTEARADEADCSVLEIKASNEGASIDKALKPLAKKFKQPPFSSWKTFKLLKRHNKTAQQMKPLAVKLAASGGDKVRTSTLTLLLRSVSTSKGKKSRLRLSVTIDDKNGKRKLESTINLDSGDHYLIGGDSMGNDSVYILATTCSVK